MSTYADHFTTNLFFVTQRAVGEEPVLGNELMMRLMQAALDWTKIHYPFERIGYLFLPEQVHLLLKPTGDASLDQIMQSVRHRFHAEYHELMNMPGTTLLWQDGHEVQRVAEVETLAMHLDYIHYLPVQRGFVAEPAAWPYGSFALWQARGIYNDRWGRIAPATLQE